MKLFSGLLRCNSSLFHEIWKHKMTPAEVILLQSMHGENCFVPGQLKETGFDKTKTQAGERLRLARTYGEKRVTDLFGPHFNPLPTEVLLAGSADPSVASSIADLERIAAQEEAEQKAAEIAEAAVSEDEDGGSVLEAETPDTKPAKRGRRSKADVMKDSEVGEEQAA